MNNDVVIIQLDRPRQVKFGHTALKMLSELSGKTIEELDAGEITPGNFELIEKMAYCGLLMDARANAEALKPEQLPELLDQAPSFTHVIEKLFAAWRVAFGGPADLPPQTTQTTEGKSQVAPAEGNSSTGKKASV